MPNITIDGRTLGVPDGTTVLRAALDAGIPIPHFCWHPAFAPEGSCRLCLVEVEGLPKLELACATVAREGLKVQTRSPRVREARRAVLEFFLADHPIDCPICDKAGECRLQDYYEEYGLTESAFREAKERRAKKVVIGEKLLLDRERCIQCTRCVRFLREVTKTGELGVFERGVRAEIGIYEGRPVASLYGGNLVDLCPVGAITDTTFRFRTRTWFLSARPSICPLCGRGCSVFLDYHPGIPRLPGSAKVYRVRPRTNEAVNGPWICDRGRYAYLEMHNLRISKISWNRGDRDVEMTREKVVAILAEKVKDMVVRTRTGRLGVILNTGLTVEELRAARGLLRRAPGARVWFADPPEGEDDGFLLQADRTANRRGAAGLGYRLDPVDLAALGQGLDMLLVFGPHLREAGPAGAVEKALAAVGTKVQLSAVPSGFEPLFDFIIPSALPSEKGGTFINADGREQSFLQALPLGVETWPEEEFLTALAAELARTS
jgi:NADH-quinone oxidoreductase subunit G